MHLIIVFIYININKYIWAIVLQKESNLIPFHLIKMIPSLSIEALTTTVDYIQSITHYIYFIYYIHIYSTRRHSALT